MKNALFRKGTKHRTISNDIQTSGGTRTNLWRTPRSDQLSLTRPFMTVIAGPGGVATVSTVCAVDASDSKIRCTFRKMIKLPTGPGVVPRRQFSGHSMFEHRCGEHE